MIFSQALATHEFAAEMQQKNRRFGADPSPRVTLYVLPMWDVSMPPLSLACLGRYLSANGISVQIRDCNVEIYSSVASPLRRYWEMSELGNWIDSKVGFPEIILPLMTDYIDALVVELKALVCEIIGFSVTKSNALFTREVLLRFGPWKGERKIVLGGHHCANDSYRALFEDLPIDYFVVGEGEEALLGICTGAIDPGIVVAKKSVDYRILGIVDFQGFDLSRYTSKTLPVFLGRGCVCRCAFCEDSIIAGQYRIRPVPTVYAELNALHHMYGITDFLFVDLLLNGKPDQIMSLCETVIAGGLPISWYGLFVIDRRNDEAFFQRLRLSGCHTVVFGLEHCSDKLLKRMRKRFRSDDIVPVLSRAKAAGLIVAVNLIVGFPGESEEDFQALSLFIRENRNSIDAIGSLNAFTLLTETPLIGMIGPWGIKTPENWKPSTQFWWDDHSIYDERNERLAKMIALIDELGLAYYSSTVDVVKPDIDAHPGRHLRCGEGLRVDGGRFFHGNLNRWAHDFGACVIDNREYPNFALYKIRVVRNEVYGFWLSYACSEEKEVDILLDEHLRFHRRLAPTGGYTGEYIQSVYLGEFPLSTDGNIVEIRADRDIPHISSLLFEPNIADRLEYFIDSREFASGNFNRWGKKYKGMITGFDRRYNFAIYRVRPALPSVYALFVRYAAATSRPVAVSYNGQPICTFLSPPSGGFTRKFVEEAHLGDILVDENGGELLIEAGGDVPHICSFRLSRRVAEKYFSIDANRFFFGNLNNRCREFKGLVTDNRVYPNFACYKIKPNLAGRFNISVRCASGEPRYLAITLNRQKIAELTAIRTGGYTTRDLANIDVGTVDLHDGGGILRVSSPGMIPHLHSFIFKRIT